MRTVGGEGFEFEMGGRVAGTVRDGASKARTVCSFKSAKYCCLSFDLWDPTFFLLFAINRKSTEQRKDKSRQRQ
jgi:hypothetical protein